MCSGRGHARGCRLGRIKEHEAEALPAAVLDPNTRVAHWPEARSERDERRGLSDLEREASDVHSCGVRLRLGGRPLGSSMAQRRLRGLGRLGSGRQRIWRSWRFGRSELSVASFVPHVMRRGVLDVDSLVAPAG
jgi:hypothetical protein